MNEASKVFMDDGNQFVIFSIIEFSLFNHSLSLFFVLRSFVPSQYLSNNGTGERNVLILKNVVMISSKDRKSVV